MTAPIQLQYMPSRTRRQRLRRAIASPYTRQRLRICAEAALLCVLLIGVVGGIPFMAGVLSAHIAGI